ncbi:uncharacterized protein LOC108629915 [Ceratina calcarata]|uniref:Uncharacterized protein LOC108629915 n=1 Tax=Ceratina calcarata TaxID=156304 RepID=A0AAJ7NCF5_9HYME|nr:uncharacterized protein LOC108629915 [Ceratina calcarata]
MTEGIVHTRFDAYQKFMCNHSNGVLDFIALGSSLDSVKPLLGLRLENTVHSLLEDFVCKSNSRYAKRFPRFKRLLDAVAAWSDCFDSSAKDTSVRREMIKHAIDYLVKNGLVTQFGDPAVLNSGPNKMDPETLPDQNALQNVWRFINEKDFWQNRDCVGTSKGRAGNAQVNQSVKEFSNSDLDVEIGSVSQESSTCYNTCRTGSVCCPANKKIENAKSVQVQVCCQDVGCVCDLSVNKVVSPRKETVDCFTNTHCPSMKNFQNTANIKCDCDIKMNSDKSVQTQKYSLVKENIKKFDMNTQCDCDKKMNNTKIVQTQNTCLAGRNVNKINMDTQCNCMTTTDNNMPVQTQMSSPRQNLIKCNMSAQCDCVMKIPTRFAQTQTSSPRRNTEKFDMNTQCDCPATVNCKSFSPTQTSSPRRKSGKFDTNTQCDCPAIVNCKNFPPTQTSSLRRNIEKFDTNTQCYCPSTINCKSFSSTQTCSHDVNFVFNRDQNALNSLNRVYEICDKPKPFPRKMNMNRLNAMPCDCNPFHGNSKLKVRVHRATSTNCPRLRVPRVSSISLPCSSSQLIVRLFEADPSLSDSCLVLMRKKFEKDINNACSCVNDILRKLGDSMIKRLCLNCDIRPGRVDLNLVCKDKGPSKTRWFLGRVPTCSNVQKLNNSSADLNKCSEQFSDQFGSCLACRSKIPTVDFIYCKGGMKCNEEFKEQLDPVLDRSLMHDNSRKRNLFCNRQERRMDTRVCPFKELPVESNFCRDKTKREEKFDTGRTTFYPVCLTPDKQNCVKNEIGKEGRGKEVSFIWSRNKQMDFVFSSRMNLQSNDDFIFSSEACIDEENCDICMNNENLNKNRKGRIVKECCKGEEIDAERIGIGGDRFVIKDHENGMMELCDCNCNYSSDSLKENFCKEDNSVTENCNPGQCSCHIFCVNNSDLGSRKTVNCGYNFEKDEDTNFEKDQDSNCVFCRLLQENSSKLENSIAKTEEHVSEIKHDVQKTNGMKLEPTAKTENRVSKMKHNVQETNSIKSKPTVKTEKRVSIVKYNMQEANNSESKTISKTEENVPKIEYNVQGTNTSSLAIEQKVSGRERDNSVSKNVTFQGLEVNSFYLNETEAHLDAEKQYSDDSISPAYPNSSDNSFDAKCSYCGVNLSNPVFDENINTENENSEKPANKRETHGLVPKASVVLKSQELKEKHSNINKKSSTLSLHDQSTNVDNELKTGTEKISEAPKENITVCNCVQESEFIKIPPDSLIGNDNSSTTESLFVFCRSTIKSSSVSDFSTEDESSSNKNFGTTDYDVCRKLASRRAISRCESPKRKYSTVCAPSQSQKNRLLRESKVASRLCDSFPAINRIKYLIRKKLGRLLLEERDKGTCTSKTFLRNDRYLVSISSGKLNKGRVIRDSCSVDSSSRCPFTARNRYEPSAAPEKTFTEGCALKKNRNAFRDIKTRCQRMIRSNDVLKKIGVNGASAYPEKCGSKSTDTQDLIGKKKLKTRNRESCFIDSTINNTKTRNHLSILSLNSGRIIFVEDHGDHSSSRKLCHEKNRTSKEDKKLTFDSKFGRNHCKRPLGGTCESVKNGKAMVAEDRTCSDKLRSFEKRLFELERKREEDINLTNFLDDYERRISELDADFRLKLLQYVALCKSVKHSLMKRIKPYDV